MFITHSATIENYRAFRKKQTIKFGVPNGNPGSGLTIITGENNSGKTSLLEIFKWISGYPPKNNGEKHARRYARLELDIENVEWENSSIRAKKKWEFTRNVRPKMTESEDLGRVYCNLHAPTIPSKRSWSAQLTVGRAKKLPHGVLYSLYEAWYHLNDDDAIFFEHFKHYFGDIILAIAEDIELKQKLNEKIKKVISFNDWRVSIKNNVHTLLYIREDGVEHSFDLLGNGVTGLFLIFLCAMLAPDDSILFIDEPELGLSPISQTRLSEQLAADSSKTQIVLLTHSPYIYRDSVKVGATVSVFGKDTNGYTKVTNMSETEKIFPWSPTWGEINYYAFGLVTEGFHDELYGYIQEKTKHFIEKDIDIYFHNEGRLARAKVWIAERHGKPERPKKVTLPVFIRNKVHHPENATMKKVDYTQKELKRSIEVMIKIVRKINKQGEELDT